MNKIIRIMIAALLLVLGVFLVSCAATASPDAIYFSKEYTLRQTYVQGQELDFSGISLTSDTKGKTETIPMDSTEISVSGYSKDTLGEQTVTVTYREKTTSFRVTVIPRITVEGYDANYFVGDAFNKQNGRVKVADDNAVISAINLKDDAVTVTGFDSSTAGTKEITVTCNGYTGSFSVNVLGVEKVTLKNPSKKAYQSHDTEFSVDGGYLTVISTGALIEKTVPLTADMVKGFDPSEADRDNNTSATAVKQTVRIEYLGFQFNFEITIRYSDISGIKDCAAKLADVDTSAPIDEELGSNAMEAVNHYLSLSPADQSKITEDEISTVARVAAVYAYDRFVKETERYSDTFVLSPGKHTTSSGTLIEYCGTFEISCDTYDHMMTALSALNDNSSDFVMLGDFLHTMEAEFPSLEVQPGVTTDQYFATLYLSDDLMLMVSVFRYMTAIYEKLSVVPDDWDTETIKAPEMVEGIESVYARIVSGEYRYLDYPELYTMISSWRTKNDAFDIMHTHYLYNKTYESEDENYLTQVWEKIPFPGDLELMYSLIAAGYSHSDYLEHNVYDTSYFMIIYRDTMRLAEQIKENGSELYRDIYYAVDFDALIDKYLYTASETGCYSYFDVIGNLTFNQELLDLIWGDYFEVIDCANDDWSIDMSDPVNAGAIEKLFRDFFSLDPYERFLFISSLYSNYRDLNIDGFVFDDKDGTTGHFIYFIMEYYVGEQGVLPESTRDLFRKLMIATEQYGIRYKHLTVASSALDQYGTMMDEISALYASLSGEDKAVFDEYASIAYTENMKMYGAVKGSVPEIATYPSLEELKTVLEFYYTLLNAIGQDEEVASESGTYALLFVTYEKAKELSAMILDSGDQEQIDAYLYYNYIVLNRNDGNRDNDYALPLEAVFDEITADAYSYIVSETDSDGNVTSYRAIDYYSEGGLPEFFADSYRMLYTNYFGWINTKEDILTLMRGYRELEDMDIIKFRLFHLDRCYYASLEMFFASVLASDPATAALADALITAEQSYTDYLLDPESAEKLEAFRTAWETAAESYAALGSATENYESCLREMYEYYLEEYNALTVAE